MLRTMRVLMAAMASAYLFLLATPAAIAGVRVSAPTSAPADSAIRVGTYNIAKTTLRGGKWAWANRRIALRNAVNAANPNVLFVQEANTQLWHGTKHIEDVRSLLGSIGYEITSTDYDSCTSWCTRGAHIFYDPVKLEIADIPNDDVVVGGTGLSVIARTWASSVQDRGVSWAFLTPIGSSRTSLYVSVHLPTDKNATGEELRLAAARRLLPWAQNLVEESGLSSAEIVIGGDLNSYARRQPSGAQAVLAAAGLTDGYSAAERVNSNRGSVNYAPKINKYRGFPPKPYYYAKIDPCRIDYIFSTVTPLRHEIFLVLDNDGKFDNNYRASDHNMVLVDLPLR